MGIYWKLPAVVLRTDPVFQVLHEIFFFYFVIGTSYGLLQASYLRIGRFMPITVVVSFPHLPLGYVLQSIMT